MDDTHSEAEERQVYGERNSNLTSNGDDEIVERHFEFVNPQTNEPLKNFRYDLLRNGERVVQNATAIDGKTQRIAGNNSLPSWHGNRRTLNEFRHNAWGFRGH